MTRKLNLNLQAGADFTTNVAILHSNGAARDMSEYTANAHYKPDFNYGNSAAFDVALANGSMTISLDSNTTSPMGSRDFYVYNAEITSNAGFVERIQEGHIYIHPDVG